MRPDSLIAAFMARKDKERPQETADFAQFPLEPPEQDEAGRRNFADEVLRRSLES